MNRIVLFMALLGFGCGHVVNVERVSSEAKGSLEELMAELRGLNRPEILGYGSPGVKITVSAAMLSLYNQKTGTCASGVHFSCDGVILLSSMDEFAYCDGDSQLKLSLVGQKLVLAHELGHAAGIIEHTDHGLMDAHGQGQIDCIGREAECLIEAIDEAKSTNSIHPITPRPESECSDVVVQSTD